MIRNILVTTALVAAFALPAAAPSFAKTAPKAKVFYLEQVVKSKACYVVAFKPAGKKVTELGTATYPTLGKALVALKAETGCAPVKHMAMKMKPKTK